jgi:hypothetical protein
MGRADEIVGARTTPQFFLKNSLAKNRQATVAIAPTADIWLQRNISR